MTRFLPHLEIAIETKDASWLGRVARLEEEGLSFILDKGLERGRPLSFRLSGRRGTVPVEGNLRVVGEAVATYGRRFRADFVDLDDEQRDYLSKLRRPDDERSFGGGAVGGGAVGPGAVGAGAVGGAAVGAGAVDLSVVTEIIHLSATPPTGVPSVRDCGSRTRDMPMSDAFSQDTAFTQCSISAPLPLPLAGREAIRAALRRSLAQKGWSGRRTEARASRLKLALGRGEIALQGPDKGKQ